MTTSGSPIWDNQETQQLVSSIFGHLQWNKAHPSVRSMIDRPEFCRYHYREATKLLNDCINSLDDFGLLGGVEGDAEFSLPMQKIRAHITAFVQSLHAIADTCSHMLFYCLAMDTRAPSLNERQIDAGRVLKLLEREAANQHPEFGMLSKMFAEMTSGQSYQHLCALSNTAKHRCIVRPALSEDVNGMREERYILFIEAFSYSGSYFEKVDARAFMQEQHDRIQPLVVDLGLTLNKVLAQLKTKKGIENAATPGKDSPCPNTP